MFASQNMTKKLQLMLNEMANQKNSALPASTWLFSEFRSHFAGDYLRTRMQSANQACAKVFEHFKEECWRMK